jgi:hypothetical protein
MLAAARRVFYADRTQPRLLSEFEKLVGADELRRLHTELSGGISDIKAADAREILVQLSRQLNPQLPA